MAGRLDRRDADAGRPAGPGRDRGDRRPGPRAGDHRPLHPGPDRADDRADPGDAAQPDPARRRRPGHQPAQCPRPVCRIGHRPDRLQRRDHPGGGLPRAGLGHRRAGDRRRDRGRGSLRDPVPAAPADRLPLQPPDQPGRPGRPPGAPADGAPGARPGRQPAHLPRGDVGLDRAGGGCRDGLHLCLLDLPAADRRDRGSARRGHPAGPVARAGPGRGRALPGPDPPGDPADPVRDDPADRAVDHRPGRGRPAPVRLRPDG